MRASTTKNGLTLRVIAGTRNAILAIDLQENKRQGCLGFSIQRTDLGTAENPLPENQRKSQWLPNLLHFPSVPLKEDQHFATTDQAPLQKFRWGDYTLEPAHTYRYKVIPQYGKPGALTTRPDLQNGVEIEITTEDPNNEETAIFFNRGAAASHTFEMKFPNLKTIDREPEDDRNARTAKLVEADTEEANEARAWLSMGLEEAILAFLRKAEKGDALHAAIYEFQKPELLQGIKEAVERGVDVQVVYHRRQKNEKDKTATKNEAAIKAAGLDDATLAANNQKPVVKPRKANPQDAIMHNKFVVLLKNDGEKPVPTAVWTGSTNWTDGGIYGQLNVGHAIYEPEVAGIYDQYFQLLHDDADASTIKHALGAISPVSLLLPSEHKVFPILSPQSNDTMLHLYAALCENARCLMVSAPFALSPIILAALTKKNPDTLRFFLLDKLGSLGKGEEVHIIEGDPSDSIAVATTLASPLHDFQGKLLEGKESFHHAGIHIHSKIILVDPFGSDPIIVTGSANFSNNSTEVNDSNTMIIRGYSAVADIYVTEFMRMFEHYHFRAKAAASKDKSKPIGLIEDDSWSDEYYVKDSNEEKDRRMFAGTF
ncbi:MAG TPA: phospholipase D-like domain-containing protein [Pyrinomonadaceae bacterium]|jgi:phosphatidylserine/phosphatidylglycerophosphate/cardiolipin synthase-like enzyme